MGYRSEVGLCLSKKAIEYMETKCQEASVQLQDAVTRLFKDADYAYEDKSTGDKMWQWSWIKWYEMPFGYEEIQFVRDVMLELEEEDYLFVRVGEELDDLESRGSYWENPFHLELDRSVLFSDAA